MRCRPPRKKYGLVPAAELEEWNIGPYCEETSCRVPNGVRVGNNNHIPVNIYVGFREGLITEIDVTFSEIYWEEILPILDQKYGADWKVDRNDSGIMNYETKKTTVREIISLYHNTNGVNRRTNDRCEIWAQNIDLVFTHHDVFGPYHSEFVIKLISKNF